MSSPPGRPLNRRALLRRSAQLSLAALLTACAGGAAAPAAQSPTSQPGAPLRLLIWHGWAGAARQALAQQVERFNRQSPAAGIVLQPVPLTSFGSELRSAALAGSGPHLALIPNTWVGALAAERIPLALDDLLDPSTKSAFIPATLSGARSADPSGEQRLFGLPLSFDTLALIYNRANLLAPPADTAELLASARGLSAPDASPPIWGFALNLSLDSIIGYLYAFEGRIFSDAGAVALGGDGRAGAERWLAWAQALAGDQRILARPESSITIDQQIKSGRALATFDWAHTIGAYRSLWGDQIGIEPLPRLAETGLAPQPYVRSDTLIVNARAAGVERETALAFLRFMAEPDAQYALLRAGLQPARTIALSPDEALTPAAAAFRAQAAISRPMPNGADRLVVEQELRFMLQQVLSGFTSPADAVSEADQRLRGRLSAGP